MAMLGFLYQIVPMLVWRRAYGREIGRGRPPAAATTERCSESLPRTGYWLYLIGLVTVSLATALGKAAAVRGSALVLAAGLGLFLVNLGCVLRHCVRPRVGRTTAAVVTGNAP